MQKLLFVLPELPYPAHKNGVTLIDYHILRYMPDGWSVDIIAESGTREEADRLVELLASVADIEILDLPGNRKAGHWKAVFSDLIGRGAKPLLDHLIAHKSYDLIYTSPLTNVTKVAGSRHVFLNAVDSYSLLNHRFWKKSGRWDHRLRQYLYELFENHFLKSVAVTSFVSEVDADWVRTHSGHRNIVSIPNGVDTGVFFDREVERTGGTLLLTGQYRYQPNREAACHMVRNILPLIRAEAELELHIVGKDAPEDLAAFPGVKVVGFAQDIALEYNRCEIFVCPLESGAGIKNKVLEAMGCAIPVVSSAIGVDGIDGAVDGEHYLLANDPASFAKAVLRLHRNPELRKHLGRNAADLIQARYQWSAMAGRYHEQFAHVMAGHPAP